MSEVKGFLEIAALPVFAGETPLRVHESCLRAWNIVERVKGLLAVGTPGVVVLELISVMESGPSDGLSAPFDGRWDDVEVVENGLG